MPSPRRKQKYLPGKYNYWMLVTFSDIQKVLLYCFWNLSIAIMVKNTHRISIGGKGNNVREELYT